MATTSDEIRQVPTFSNRGWKANSAVFNAPQRLWTWLSVSIVMLGLWLASASCQAALLTPESRQQSLSESLQFLEDPTGRLTLSEVQRLGASFREWTGRGSELNFGFTTSAYWIRIPVKRLELAPADWLLELHNVKINQLDFYPPTGPAIHTGSREPLNTRPYFDRFFVIPLKANTQEENYYLRVTSNFGLAIPLTLWHPDAYRKRQYQIQSLHFMYSGAMLLLSLYGLVIYLALRDQRFLAYSAYTITAALGIFAGNGFGRLLIWPNSPSFEEVSQSTFLSLAAYFSVQFALRFLLLTKERSWLANSLRWGQSIFLGICLLTPLQLIHPSLHNPVNQLLLINSVLMGLLISFASVQAILKKRPGVQFFLIGWLVFWFGVLVAALRAFGWIPSNAITSYALQLSTIFEMMMMALALGYLLKVEHDAYGTAQYQALAANRELLEISQHSESKLQAAVKIQTEKLEASLHLEKVLREQYVRFGSMISHEFRTPLSIIQIQASLMRKEHERGLNHVNKRVQAIGSACQRLTVMFDKWLHSDAIAQTLDELDIKPLSLDPWLRKWIDTIPHLYLDHHLVLKPYSSHIRVLADEYHIGVAISNLIDNAAKYAPVNTTITIDIQRRDEKIGISISDQGPGIPLELQNKVFSEFFRQPTKHSTRGLGLGLSIVDRIAKAHGGHIELSSVPGHGATFCIWIPTATN